MVPSLLLIPTRGSTLLSLDLVRFNDVSKTELFMDPVRWSSNSQTTRVFRCDSDVELDLDFEEEGAW